MPDYFQNKYRIDSHRFKNWDYRTPGWYFVTICTGEGIHYFGEINDDIMGLSDIGGETWAFWYEIPDHHPHVKLGEFIVMPNHVHLTIRLTNHNPGNTTVETCHGTSLHSGDSRRRNGYMAEIAPKSGSVSIIINQYKGALKTWCKKNGDGDFAWQPGFHDHIVRTPRSLYRINAYIRTNPERWEEDRYHPDNRR